MHTAEQGGSLADRMAARLLQTRWVVRALVPVFRIGLGAIGGGRLLLLEHRGRASGRRRFVVLEVVDRPAPDRVVIASGFGVSAQWYRNLVANGIAFVTLTGLRARRAVPTFLDEKESRSQLVGYGARHPSAWRHLRGAMAIAQGVVNPDIRIVVLDLADRRHP
ncbi:nitroreductase family deazaflavin-dependent oxidoreductase [Lysinimonas soli]|uniref:Nitroreductase family deazaflavin-dependent oxidoreductase n=1 Tax=Lysinimonas soli TaxID=1074233 RepID=A0ABW0NW05_9MICO